MAFRWLSISSRSSKSESPAISTSSSARSSPSLANMNRVNFESQQDELSTQDVDSWGQFVDTAEAEEEFMRQGRLLGRLDSH